MSEEDKKDMPPLPPKLDLRKRGIIRDTPPAEPKPAEPVAATPQAPPLKIAQEPSARPPSGTGQPVKPAAAAPAQASAQPDISIKAGETDEPSSRTVHIQIPDAAAAKEYRPVLKPPPGREGEKPLRPTVLTPRPAAEKPPQPTPQPAQPAAPTQAAEPKKDTSRIPLEAAKAVAPAAQGKTPKTIRIKPVSAASPFGRRPVPPAKQEPEPETGNKDQDVSKQAEKRKTSRISLEAALSPEEGTNKPKTIRLKPPSEAATVKRGPLPLVKKTSAPESQAAAGDMLGKTSKLATRDLSSIPVGDTSRLDAGQAAGAAGDMLGKTSKLATRDLSSIPAGDTSRLDAGQAAGAAGDMLGRTSKLGTSDLSAAGVSETSRLDEKASAVMGKTARLDMPPVEAESEELSPTRKKTIRVKRASSAGKPSVSVTRPQEAETGDESAGPAPSPAAARMPEIFVPAEEKTSWVFPFLAIAAVLVACVVIYVLAAQAFGPNPSLTKLSYGAPSLDLSWPGKISRVQ